METFTIKTHVTSLSVRLHRLQQVSDLCDLRLTSTSNDLDLHKVVLAAMTDLALVKVKSSCQTTPTSGIAQIKIQDCSSAVLDSIAEFLYLGVLKFQKDNLKSILGVLEDIGVLDLVQELTQHEFLNEEPVPDSNSPPLAVSRSRRNCKSTWNRSKEEGREEKKPPEGQRGTGEKTGSVKRGRGRPRMATLKKVLEDEPTAAKKRKASHREEEETSLGTEEEGEKDGKEVVQVEVEERKRDLAKSRIGTQRILTKAARKQLPESQRKVLLREGIDQVEEEVLGREEEEGKDRKRDMKSYEDLEGREKEVRRGNEENAGGKRDRRRGRGEKEEDGSEVEGKGREEAKERIGGEGIEDIDNDPSKTDNKLKKTELLDIEIKVEDREERRVKRGRERKGIEARKATLSKSEDQGRKRKSKVDIVSKDLRQKNKQCYKCKEEFPSPEECAIHRAACTAAKRKTDKNLIRELPFVCRKCFQRFSTEDLLTQHKKTCKVKRQRIERKCRKCQITFKDLEKLKIHRKIHEMEWNRQYVRVKQYFPCQLCSYMTRNEKTLLIHMTNKHDKPLEGTDKHPLLLCQFPGCTYKTLHQFQLKNHTFIHKDSRKFMCEICGKGFKQRNVLDVHVKTVHTEATIACPECGKTLKTMVALKTHINRVHLQVKNLQCPQCSFTTFDRTTMESHQYSKHNIPYPPDRKRYECEVCGYVTRWRCQYNSHMRRHKGEYPYQCKVCNKCFPCKSDLTSHSKWHFDKKYKCTHESCKYSTCLPGKLQAHIRTVHTHRDVKPFKCHVCDYRTNLRSNLFIHLRKVHKLSVPTKHNRVAILPSGSTNEAPPPTTTTTTTTQEQNQPKPQQAPLGYPQVCVQEQSEIQGQIQGQTSDFDLHEQPQGQGNPEDHTQTLIKSQDLFQMHQQNQDIFLNQAPVEHLTNVQPVDNNIRTIVLPSELDINIPKSNVRVISPGQIQSQDLSRLTNVLTNSQPQEMKNIATGSQQKPVVVQISAETLELLQKQLQQPKQFLYQQSKPLDHEQLGESSLIPHVSPIGNILTNAPPSQNEHQSLIQTPIVLETIRKYPTTDLLLPGTQNRIPNSIPLLRNSLTTEPPLKSTEQSTLNADILSSYPALLSGNFVAPSQSLGEGEKVELSMLNPVTSVEPSGSLASSSAQSSIMSSLPLTISDIRNLIETPEQQ